MAFLLVIIFAAFMSKGYSQQKLPVSPQELIPEQQTSIIIPVPEQSDSQVNDSPQQATISGIVTDKEGTPQTGVTVLVKGTSVGTLTDIDGKFTLALPPNAQTLGIQFCRNGNC